MNNIIKLVGIQKHIGRCPLNKLDSKFGFPVENVIEGKTSFLAPKLKEYVSEPQGFAPSKAPVFYNPRMELNRDFAVVFLQAFQKILGREIRVCEPLAGCGVRGLRFAVEVDGIERVVLNDISEKAFEILKFNVRKIGVRSKVIVENSDANVLLIQYSRPKKRFDYIDIDPFGSPIYFIESSLMALRNGGVLALTATDMPTLCGVHPKACIRKYGIKPLRTEYCHELAVRILIGCLTIIAARRELAVEPLFCHSTDHYIRVYVRIRKGALRSDECLKKLGYVFHCLQCLNRWIEYGLFARFETACKICGGSADFAGPLWLGKLWNEDFCKNISEEINIKTLGQKMRMIKIMSKIFNEVEAPPTYYLIDYLCDFYGVSMPSMKEIIKKLRREGYSTFLTHFNPQGIKTTAPITILGKILKK